VVYVDNDPIVTSHNEALLAGGNDRVLALDADIRRPHNILANDDLCRLIDFSRPIGVLCVAMLHFISDEDDPYGPVASFTRLMTHGSFLALSHITCDGTSPDVTAAIHDAYRGASAPAVFRTTDQIQEFFDGLDLIGGREGRPGDFVPRVRRLGLPAHWGLTTPPRRAAGRRRWRSSAATGVPGEHGELPLARRQPGGRVQRRVADPGARRARESTSGDIIVHAQRGVAVDAHAVSSDIHVTADPGTHPAITARSVSGRVRTTSRGARQTSE